MPMNNPNNNTADPTNADRVERARKGLEYYKRRLLGESGPVDESTVEDVLCDLMHLSAADPEFPFQQSLDVAEINFNAESAAEAQKN